MSQEKEKKSGKKDKKDDKEELKVKASTQWQAAACSTQHFAQEIVMPFTGQCDGVSERNPHVVVTPVPFCIQAWLLAMQRQAAGREVDKDAGAEKDPVPLDDLAWEVRRRTLILLSFVR